jgi:hypothetical protein
MVHYCLAVSPIISAEDFQPLSEKEERDLELLMKECGFAAKDAKAFTDMLASQLMALDGVSNFNNNHNISLTSQFYLV